MQVTNQLIANLPTEYAKAIGMKGTEVFLSSASLEKNLAHHPDVSVADYERLPLLISNPDMVIQDGERTLIATRDTSGLWLAAIKSTQTGQAAFVTSFRRTTESDIARKLKQGVVLDPKRKGDPASPLVC
jgi:hypothetical protein